MVKKQKNSPSNQDNQFVPFVLGDLAYIDWLGKRQVYRVHLFCLDSQVVQLKDYTVYQKSESTKLMSVCDSTYDIGSEHNCSAGGSLKHLKRFFYLITN